jgi:hypothetical protein
VKRPIASRSAKVRLSIRFSWSHKHVEAYSPTMIPSLSSTLGGAGEAERKRRLRQGIVHDEVDPIPACSS